MAYLQGRIVITHQHYYASFIFKGGHFIINGLLNNYGMLISAWLQGMVYKRVITGLELLQMHLLYFKRWCI